MQKRIEVTNINVREDGWVSYMERVVVYEDDMKTVVSRGEFSTKMLTPGDDLSGEAPLVAAVAKAAHTEERVTLVKLSKEIPVLEEQVERLKQQEMPEQVIDTLQKPLDQKLAERDAIQTTINQSLIKP